MAYVKAADQRWYLCDDAWVTAGGLGWACRAEKGRPCVWPAPSDLHRRTALPGCKWGQQGTLARCGWRGHLLTRRPARLPPNGPPSAAADEEAVRNCQAYMLFYSQRRLLEGREPAAAAAASARQTRSQAAGRK